MSMGSPLDSLSGKWLILYPLSFVSKVFTAPIRLRLHEQIKHAIFAQIRL